VPFADDEITLWLVNQTQAKLNAALYQSWLNDAERERLAAFRFDKHKRQFLLTRALVRSVLSRYVPSKRPCEWSFTQNAFGKPQVANSPVPLFFNLSHTDDVIALAVSPRDFIGVDVEPLQRDTDLVAVAKRYFAPAEGEGLENVPKAMQRSHLLNVWTLKEAYIKACGQGLAIPLGDVAFTLREKVIDVAFDAQRADDAARWQFWQYHYQGAHLLALAQADAPAMNVRAMLWSAPDQLVPFELLLVSSC